jgi:hypothetical protein
MQTETKIHFSKRMLNIGNILEKWCRFWWIGWNLFSNEQTKSTIEYPVGIAPVCHRLQYRAASA